MQVKWPEDTDSVFSPKFKTKYKCPIHKRHTWRLTNNKNFTLRVSSVRVVRSSWSMRNR